MPIATSRGRRTISLDGDGWRIRPHLGLEAALEATKETASAASAASPDSTAGDRAAIHAIHAATDRASGWLPARVPGCVMDDLARAGEIADPYVERNSRLAEWVPERAWTYRRVIDVPRLAPGERAWLSFEGIDGAGHVFLDGVAIGSHHGLFVPFEVEIGDRIRGAGRHELAVVVEPAPASEPQVGRTSNVRVHRPRMSYGWDFCPRLVQQGLWQSVSLIIASPVRIADVWARPRLAADLASATVSVEVSLDLAGEAAGAVTVDAEVTAAAGAGSAAGVRARVDVTPGEASAHLELDLDRPALWWPNGLGTAALYQLRVRASLAGGVVDERSVPVGFRRIERVANPGASPDARPWSFVVNDRPLEIKGWNWTPLDALYGVPRPERLGHLLRLVAASHANLIRVWGGGLIETDAFYDACDRLGILVWQEFSQSSSGVDNAPSTDPAFVERMRTEADAIVPLRRNHPSLAIWCGGNELQTLAGRPLEDGDSRVLAALHDAVARLDPDRIWLPTSPSGPRFHNRLADIEADPDGLHDVHGPWEHQGLAAHRELWDRGTSLFNAEFGVEGMTNRRSHERLIRPEHRWPADRSNAIYRHLGDWWNNTPLVQAAFDGRLTELETLRRASHHLQADGLRYAVEANRRRWPRNGGSIPWQLDESYPNAWCTSVVDHRGDVKPAWYAVRRAYARALVCARFATPVVADATELTVAVVAWDRDRAASEHGRDAGVRWRLVSATGDVTHEASRRVDLRGGRPVTAFDGEVPVAPDMTSVFFLDLLLEDADGSALAADRYLLTRATTLAPLLDLAPATVDLSVDRRGDIWCVRLTHRAGPAAVGMAALDGRPIDEPGWAEVDDGAFDLLPGETHTIVARWADAPDEGRRLVVDGWNVAAVDIR